MKLRILQWNILYKEKIENVLKLIKKINPDIICLQELTLNGKWNNYKNTARWLAKRLNYDYYFMPYHKFKEGTISGNGILSRYPIKKGVSIRIGRLYGKEKYESYRYIETTLNIDSYLLKIGTVHLSFFPYLITTNEKKKEFSQLFKKIKKKKRRFIFTGDLNARPNSYIIRMLRKKFKHCGPDFKLPTWTTKPFDFKGFKENRLRWRIDYVFATKDIKVVSSNVRKTRYSDHLPICIDFTTK